MEQARGYCPHCTRDVLLTKPGVNHILHLLISLLTVGLWFPVWLVLAMKPGGWRCSSCGRKVLRRVLR